MCPQLFQPPHKIVKKQTRHDPPHCPHQRDKSSVRKMATRIFQCSQTDPCGGRILPRMRQAPDARWDVVPSCEPGTKASLSPHQPDAWLPRQQADAPETVSRTLCPSSCSFLGSSNGGGETASCGHLGAECPGSSHSFKPITHLPRTRLSRQISAQSRAAASLELPPGSWEARLNFWI